MLGGPVVSKGVIAFVIILAILGVGAYYISKGGFGIQHPVTIKTVSTIPANTTVHATTFSTTILTTSLPPVNFTSCIAKTQNANINNGDFSSGNYSGWNVSGAAWGTKPLNITFANNNEEHYGSKWANYKGTFFATTYQVGTYIGSGNLTSHPFVATEPYINFRIVSSQQQQLYVQIFGNNKLFTTVHYDTFNTSLSGNYLSNFFNVSIGIAPILCQNVTINVVSGVANPPRYDYIAVGDFYMSKRPMQDPGVGVTTS